MVPDPRCGRKTKHDHAEVLLCLAMGFLAGRSSIRRSLNWCKSHLTWLRNYLPLENGIASLSTASRILSTVDEELFVLAFMEWIGEILNTKGIHIIIDGKALRGAVSKVKGERAPMIMNAIDAATGLVLTQLPISDKTCEIVAIPDLLKLLDIHESTVTIDAIGTQTKIMTQIKEQGGHFAFFVKKNQPQSYEEIMRYFEELSSDYKSMKSVVGFKPKYPKMMEVYEEYKQCEKNRDRYEHRWCKVCREPSLLTKTQEEWPFIKTLAYIKQIRIPLERDAQGNETTPDIKTFLKKGSRRRPKPIKGESEASDIQEIGMISDRELTAKELSTIKRNHWTIENRLHHVLDDTFREDRSPAKKSKNNLALIRKFAYNILRLALIRSDNSKPIPELMDDFCDDLSQIEKYIFNGINSFY